MFVKNETTNPDAALVRPGMAGEGHSSRGDLVGRHRLCADTGYTFDLLPDWRATLWAFVVFVLGARRGSFWGFLLWLLLSGLHEKLARKNGAPFAVGDRVQILAGPRKGTVSRVYSAWQGNTVRVRLGEREEENFKDIFSPHQLLREDDDEYNP